MSGEVVEIDVSEAPDTALDGLNGDFEKVDENTYRGPRTSYVEQLEGLDVVEVEDNSSINRNGPANDSVWAETAVTSKIRSRLAELRSDENRSMNTQNIAWEATQAILNVKELATMRDTEEIWHWDEDSGIWQPNGDQVVRNLCELGLAEWYKNQIKNEVLEKIRTKTFVDRAQFGAPTRTIAVRNGLLDLKNRELQDLEPSHNAIRRIPVKFDTDAECPEFRSFIEEVVPDSEDRMALQEFTGYCLLQGELPIHRALMIVGDGANGKSTFLSVVESLLGGEQGGGATAEAENNVVNHSLHDLAQKGYCKADLYGRLANIDPDLHAGELKAYNDFKSLVGGDTVQADRKYEHPIKFKQTAKLLFGANEVPDIEHADLAFYRRWLLVHFPIWIPPDDRDPTLKDTLTSSEELSGVLNWALDGLDRLLEQQEFTGEGTVVEKEETWTTWGSSVDRFVQDCIADKNEGSAKVSTSEMHDRFTRYCRNHDLDTESQRTLTTRLKEHNVGDYSPGNLRINGRKQRGFHNFAWSDDAPIADTDSSERENQQLVGGGHDA